MAALQGGHQYWKRKGKDRYAELKEYVHSRVRPDYLEVACVAAAGEVDRPYAVDFLADFDPVDETDEGLGLAFLARL